MDRDEIERSKFLRFATLLDECFPATYEHERPGGENIRVLLADRDRLASDLQATRAELESARFANRVLDSAAKDAQAWAYQLQECRAELAMVRRNHLRRMARVSGMRSREMFDEARMTEEGHDPDSWLRRNSRRLFKLATACRATLATMETGRG